MKDGVHLDESLLCGKADPFGVTWTGRFSVAGNRVWSLSQLGWCSAAYPPHFYAHATGKLRSSPTALLVCLPALFGGFARR